MTELLSRWQRLLPGVDSTFADLAARYGETGRHYHTLEHIRAVLARIDDLWPDAPPALRFAAWLHDVVYDSRASDNEERSADYARAILPALGVPPDVVEETARLILLTRSHEADPDDRAGRTLLDADLAVLAGDGPTYDAYAAAIRLEYAWVPESDYRAGRRRVLERFLVRPRIFLTMEMAEAEPRARDNLRREIERFGS
jgi:predicted metal-dependent HD superfamily phosphohydrolase